MSNLKDIKDRIISINSTQKITKAMKMVAAAKVKKVENLVKASRPFSEELVNVFKRTLRAAKEFNEANLKITSPLDNYPEFLTRVEIKTIGMVIITSNKGLAGAYNANVVREALANIKKYNQNGKSVKIFLVGQKGKGLLKSKQGNLDFEVVKTYTKFGQIPSPSASSVIAEDLAEFFMNGEIDSIEIVTTKFKNMMSYKVEDWDVLPLSFNHESDKPEPEMIFEPNTDVILQKIVPLYISNTIYQALLEALASELASRMAAMSAATNNAEDMIKTLTVDYNKARQSAITQELNEVVSGADALKK